MYFRRLSEVPSHWKFLFSSVLSKLDKKGLSKRAILLMLRNHHSREEKLLLVVRVARKQKEREFWEVSWLTLYPLKCTARGICWLRMMYHTFGWWLQKGQAILFFIVFFFLPQMSQIQQWRFLSNCPFQNTVKITTLRAISIFFSEFVHKTTWCTQVAFQSSPMSIMMDNAPRPFTVGMFIYMWKICASLP